MRVLGACSPLSRSMPAWPPAIPLANERATDAADRDRRLLTDDRAGQLGLGALPWRCAHEPAGPNRAPRRGGPPG